jgi:hypothetical protein
MGYQDFAGFIADALRSEPTAARLVSALTQAFPHFRDTAEWRTPEGDHASVELDKKALVAASELCHRLRHQRPELDFPDLQAMPPYATAASINYLVRAGVLARVDPQERPEDFVGPFRGPVLRAAATLAMDRLAERVREVKQGLAAVDVAFYLDDVASDEQFEGPKFVPRKDSSAL